MVLKNYQPTRGHRNDFDRDHRYRARRVRAVGIDVDQMQPIETGSIFTNRTLPPLQTAGRHKRPAFFIQRPDLFRSDLSSYPVRPGAGRHRSGQGRPKLP